MQTGLVTRSACGIKMRVGTAWVTPLPGQQWAVGNGVDPVPSVPAGCRCESGVFAADIYGASGGRGLRPA